MTQIQTLIQDIFVHLEERGWQNPQPGSLAKSIVLESAELLENFQWSEPQADALRSNPQKLQAVQAELADVLIYCFQLAKILELDPEEIVRQKLQKVAEKYPAEKVLNNQSEYWKIKKQFREG